MRVMQVTNNVKVEEFTNSEKVLDFLRNSCRLDENRAEHIFYGLQNGAFKAVRVTETTILVRIQ